MARSKGKVGEREAVRLLRELTGRNVRRRVRQDGGDSDIVGLPNWSIEVKRYSRVTPALIRGWWAQAVKQASATGNLPLLMYRANQGQWRCVWPSALHVTPKLERFENHSDTVEADPLTWWRMTRLVIPAT